MYTNPQKVRDLLGVSIDDAPDALLTTYIGYGDQIIIKSITETIVDEDLDQDGASLNYFRTVNPYIADLNKDKIVNTLDVTVYYWDDNNNTIPLTITSIDGLTGQVVLSEVPGDTIDPRMNYNRYICKPDWTLIELASTYYAAFMWVGRELYLVPERYFLGDLRVYGSKPWEHFKKQFDRLIQIIVNQPISKVEYQKMVINPRSAVDEDELSEILKERGFI